MQFGPQSCQGGRLNVNDPLWLLFVLAHIYCILLLIFTNALHPKTGGFFWHILRPLRPFQTFQLNPNSL